jgi:hypothetical protein
MLRRIKVWLWKKRLAHARKYRIGFERFIVRERARINYDVEHCEVMLARAEMAIVEHRANTTLAANTK